MARGDGRRRVAIYRRVSTGDEDNDRQERDLVEYAERAGFEVVGFFRETLSGARKAKGKRPVERKRATGLAQRRGIGAVLVTETTRWGRSTQGPMDTLGQLASWGSRDHSGKIVRQEPAEDTGPACARALLRRRPFGTSP